MIETAVAETWIYERLTGDATLMSMLNNDRNRVLAYIAPLSTPEPFVIFSHQASADFGLVGGRRLWSEVVYVVKVVDKGGSSSRAYDIAKRIDELLHNASGPAGAGEVLVCTRERLVAYVEYDGKETYRHIGGLYRIYAQNGG